MPYVVVELAAVHSWLGNWTMENREKVSRIINHQNYTFSNNCLLDLLSLLLFSVTLLELQMLIAARTPGTARKVLMLMTRLDYTLCAVTTGLILHSPPPPPLTRARNSSHPHLALADMSVQRGGKISHLEKI